MPFLELDGIRFHYEDRGAGLPFVFQHGLGGDTGQILGVFPPPLPLRLLTLDSRGHGETRPLGPPEQLRFDRFGDDLLAWMDALGLEQAVVGGISMGAGLALNFALRYPRRVRALVLARPAWLEQPLPANLQVYPRIAALIRTYGVLEGRARFAQSAEYQALLHSHPAGASSLIKQFERERAMETAAILERLPGDAPNRSREAWGGIRVPTLVLANERDPVHPLEYGQALAAAIPGARLERITSKEVDAELHNRELRAAILRFLEVGS